MISYKLAIGEEIHCNVFNRWPDEVPVDLIIVIMHWFIAYQVNRMML